MAASAGTPAASACTACARPISAPSSVTAELRAMFWDLKGATRRPRREYRRQRPAARKLLPTPDEAPCSISVLADRSATAGLRHRGQHLVQVRRAPRRGSGGNREGG